MSYAVAVPGFSLVVCWSQPCLADLTSWLVLGPTSLLQICVAIIELLAETSLDQFLSCSGTMGLWPLSACSSPLSALFSPSAAGSLSLVEPPALLHPDNPVPPSAVQVEHLTCSKIAYKTCYKPPLLLMVKKKFWRTLYFFL